MDLFAPSTEQLLSWGPLLVLLLTFLETVFITGLVVPAGVAVSFASFMAAQGLLGLPGVLAAAAAGAALGDTIGFAIGRYEGSRLVDGTGWIAERVRRHRGGAGAMLSKEPLWSVTVARLVPYVRTLVPLMAGINRLAYSRFLLYDLLGVVAYVAVHGAAGYLAGESWEAVSRALGVGMTLMFVAFGFVIWLRVKRRGTAGGGVRGRLSS